jgi:hypothetical protein
VDLREQNLIGRLGSLQEDERGSWLCSPTRSPSPICITKSPNSNRQNFRLFNSRYSEHKILQDKACSRFTPLHTALPVSYRLPKTAEMVHRTRESQAQASGIRVAAGAALFALSLLTLQLESVDAFSPSSLPRAANLQFRVSERTTLATRLASPQSENEPKQYGLLADLFGDIPIWKHVSHVALTGFFTTMVMFSGPVWAENELSDKYGGGLDTSLVDQTCLVNQCSLQATACLKDDPDCRKGLTCTAKCLGDNACITGCFARYGNGNLDRLLKCSIEDNECIKVAILPGGADKYGEEPRAPGPTVARFDPRTLEGNWFKVVGFNPNYDCYACQRNSFEVTPPATPFGVSNKLDMQVEFSMPHLLPDGSPPPPTNVRELIRMEGDGQVLGTQASVALNDYHTRETMVFDQVPNVLTNLAWTNKQGEELSYARTAHSEGEMFGLSK